MTNPQPTNIEHKKQLGEILAIGSKQPEMDFLTQSLAHTLLLSTIVGSSMDVAIPIPLGPTSSAMFSAAAYGVIRQCKNPSPSDSIKFTRDTQEGRVRAVAGYIVACIIAPIFTTIITNFLENPKQRVNRLRFEEVKRSGFNFDTILSLTTNTEGIQDDGSSELEKMYLKLRSSESELKKLSLKEFTKLIKAASIELEELSSLYKDHKKAKNKQLLEIFNELGGQLESETDATETLKTLTTHYKTYYKTNKEPSLQDLSRFIAKHSRVIDLKYNSNFGAALKNQVFQNQDIQATQEFHGKIENALLLSYLTSDTNNFDKALKDIINKELRKSTTFTGFDDEKMWEAIKKYFQDNSMEEGISFCEQHEQSSQRMQIFFNNTSIVQHLKFDVKGEAAKKEPSGCCSCYHSRRMEEEELVVSI